MKPIHLAALALLATAATPQQDDPLTHPIAPEAAAKWIGPQAPIRVYGNAYLVGFQGMNVGLIDTGKGLILIDGAVPQSVRSVEANLRTLGFRIQDVKLILSTEPHFDHAGGIAALARDTGATVVASLRGAEGLRSGRLADDDPQRGYDGRFPAVPSVQVIRDGETLRLGNTVVTARATPGHTMGSMSWTWRSCQARQCKSVVFASSLNPVSADGYRFTSPSSRPLVAGFHRSYAAMAAMRCDILITAHADQYGAKDRFQTAPGACRAYARAAERALSARMRKERAM
jgi:metallo-beta-lactamase class B